MILFLLKYNLYTFSTPFVYINNSSYFLSYLLCVGVGYTNHAKSTIHKLGKSSEAERDGGGDIFLDVFLDNSFLLCFYKQLFSFIG